MCASVFCCEALGSGQLKQSAEQLIISVICINKIVVLNTPVLLQPFVPFTFGVVSLKVITARVETPLSRYYGNVPIQLREISVVFRKVRTGYLKQKCSEVVGADIIRLSFGYIVICPEDELRLVSVKQSLIVYFAYIPAHNLIVKFRLYIRLVITEKEYDNGLALRAEVFE